MYPIEIKSVAFVRNTRSDVVDDQWNAVESCIELEEGLPEECFEGIEAFSHLEILFYFHKSQKILLGSEHPRENPDLPKVGIFSQRKKDRPNHLGTTIVSLVRREGRSLFVHGLDALDGTPVMDIKPVFRQFLPEIADVRQPEWVDDIMKKYWE